MKPLLPDDPDALLTQGEVARLLRCSPRTLEKARYLGSGIPHVRVSGRMIRYRVADVREFIRSRVRRSTSDDGSFEPQREGRV